MCQFPEMEPDSALTVKKNVRMDETLYARVRNFRFTRRYSSETAAFIAIIQAGLDAIEVETAE